MGTVGVGGLYLSMFPVNSLLIREFRAESGSLETASTAIAQEPLCTSGF
jgi:hypothetical protein